MRKSAVVLAGLTGLGTFVVAAAHAAEDAPRDREAALVELGRRLFFDPAVGRRGKVACSACHDPEHGFSDARVRPQDEDRELPRHSQSLVDLGGPGFHWDGEFDTVRDVIDARVLPAALARRDAAERASAKLSARTIERLPFDAPAAGATAQRLASGQGYGGAVVQSVQMSIAGRLSADGTYDAGFVAAFADKTVTPWRVGDALEAYVRSLASTTSPFDRFAAGDAKALSESGARGFELFRGKANCSQCHSMDAPSADGARAAFTDRKFHNTGVETRRVETPPKAKNGKKPTPDLGRLATTFGDADRGAFKTPSLRDVANRAPYFHDGSGASLAEVVDYYDKGGTKNDHLDARVVPLGLTAQERADLVSFLESLTGDVRPGLGKATALRTERIAVHVENLDGTPCADALVHVAAAGDRLADVASLGSERLVRTDANGDAVVETPRSTHVVLSTDAGNATPMLPDWTKSVRLVVTPKERASVTVRFPDDAAARPERFVAYSSRQPTAPVRFEKVRDISATETLYAAPALGQRPSMPHLVCLDPVMDAGMVFPLVVSSGASNRVDLRLEHPPEDPAETAASEAAVQKFLAAVGGPQRPK